VLGLIDDQSFARPEVVEKHMNALKVFTKIMNDATQTVLASLSTSLGLPRDNTLQGYHRLNVSSPDIIRLLKYDSQPVSERGDTHTPHTDIGTLTFLFTRQPGLQMYASDSQTWSWILPRDDLCPIVNLGDSMAMLTNKFFPSCLHKVGPPPNGGVMRKESIAYLVRPEVGRPLVGTETKWIPAMSNQRAVFSAEELLEEKFKALRGDTRSAILTGDLA
jgi:isopenicillin N synthase-like dioxygenase